MNDEVYYRNMLHDYADGSLAQSEREDIKRHLSGCAGCRTELEELRNLFSMTGSLPRVIEPEHDLWEGIAQRLADKSSTMPQEHARAHRPAGKQFSRKGISSPAQWMLRSAAVFLAVLTFALSFWLASRNPVSRPQASRLELLPQGGTIATDPGSAYSLRVDPNGDGFLQVTTGWVALGLNGRESVVPAGSMCRTKPGVGPGTPCRKDASPVLRTALARFDFENGGSTALDSVLSASQPEDYATLWNLLFRAKGDDRCKTYDRLAELIPPPAGVTRDGFLNGDPKMVGAWKKQLNIAMNN